MRLLNAETLELEEFFNNATRPKYAILSHTWGDEEVLFRDMTIDKEYAKKKKGFAKVAETCKQARQDGYDYCWVDTCCIDKTSSAELSEAINSMWTWYRESDICYVFLQDCTRSPLGDNACISDEHTVDAQDQPQMEDHTQSTNDASSEEAVRKAGGSAADAKSEFMNSRWFTRGWTLQELLAPCIIHFFGSNWRSLGSLPELMDLVSERTKISSAVLRKDVAVKEVSIAKRMSWASQRVTTRIEDEAYSMLGIFDINMPLLYGEGQKAFVRLQKEIIRGSSDHSIFIWQCHRATEKASVPWWLPGGTATSATSHEPMYLACSAADFALSDCVRPLPRPDVRAPLAIQNRGLEISVRMGRSRSVFEPIARAYLECFDERQPAHLLSLPLVAAGLSDPLKATEFVLAHEQRFPECTKSKSKPVCIRRITILDTFERTHGTAFDVSIQFVLPKRATRIWRQNATLQSVKVIEAYPSNAWNCPILSCRLQQSPLGHETYSYALTVEVHTPINRVHGKEVEVKSTQMTILLSCSCDSSSKAIRLRAESLSKEERARYDSLQDLCATRLLDLDTELHTVVGRWWRIDDIWWLAVYYIGASSSHPYDTLALVMRSRLNIVSGALADLTRLMYALCTSGDVRRAIREIIATISANRQRGYDSRGSQHAEQSDTDDLVMKNYSDFQKLRLWKDVKKNIVDDLTLDDI